MDLMAAFRLVAHDARTLLLSQTDQGQVARTGTGIVSAWTVAITPVLGLILLIKLPNIIRD
jgi:hypothetical protein